MIDLAEAVLLAGREGDVFDGVVVDEDRRGTVVQLVDPAVLARVRARRSTPATRSGSGSTMSTRPPAASSSTASADRSHVRIETQQRALWRDRSVRRSRRIWRAGRTAAGQAEDVELAVGPSTMAAGPTVPTGAVRRPRCPALADHLQATPPEQ